MIWQTATASEIFFLAEDIFSKIFQSEVEHKVSPESVVIVVGFFLILVIMVTMTFLFSKKPKKLTPDTPINWITDKAHVKRLMDSAVVQRSKIRVSFYREENGARSTSAALVSANGQELALEFASLKNANLAWVGRDLDCGFNMRDPDNPKLFTNYTFVATIVNTLLVPGDILHVTLAYPERMEITQYRSSLRVEPPEKYVRAVSLWDVNKVKQTAGRAQHPESWGKPMLASEPKGRQELVLENISGGGLRLKIMPEALSAHDEKLAVSQQFYCRLTLMDIQMETDTTYYVVCNLLKCFDDCLSKTNLSLGMSFTYEGMPEEPPLTGLRWKAVTREWGVRDLDDWAFEMHLELYRNRGE